MSADGRILVSGGHEFNRRDGNDALCDLVVELAESSHPRVCLLPTASGDPQDQIASFRRAFGERGCEPSEISLFRLGERPVEVREHLLSQDVIYAGGGSMLNLLAIWRAHGIDRILRECWEQGILLCGQSAGAMCWFEQGVTCSSGAPSVAAGIGILPGSACVHYEREPRRARFYRQAIHEAAMQPGIALADQTAALYEGTRMTRSFTAREGADIRAVGLDPPEGNGAAATEAAERVLRSERIADAREAIDHRSAEIVEFREALSVRSRARRAGRSRIGRLD
jgi:peptidase E